MKRDDVARFVELLISEIWENHDHSKLDQFYHEDLEGYYNDDKVDFASFAKEVQVHQAHRVNIKVEMADLLIDKQMFAIRGSFKLNRDSNNLVIPMIYIGYLREGKIEKCYLKSEVQLFFNYE